MPAPQSSAQTRVPRRSRPPLMQFFIGEAHATPAADQLSDSRAARNWITSTACRACVMDWTRRRPRHGKGVTDWRPRVPDTRLRIRERSWRSDAMLKPSTRESSILIWQKCVFRLLPALAVVVFVQQHVEIWWCRERERYRMDHAVLQSPDHLPPTLRSSSTTLGQFQSRLKTSLFRLAYRMWRGAFVTV